MAATASRMEILGKLHFVNLNGTPPKQGEMVSTDKADQGIEPGDERNKVEMVANRPTPDSVKEIEAKPGDTFAPGRAASATAAS